MRSCLLCSAQLQGPRVALTILASMLPRTLWMSCSLTIKESPDSLYRRAMCRTVNGYSTVLVFCSEEDSSKSGGEGDSSKPWGAHLREEPSAGQVTSTKCPRKQADSEQLRLEIPTLPPALGEKVDAPPPPAPPPGVEGAGMNPPPANSLALSLSYPSPRSMAALRALGALAAASSALEVRQREWA